MIQDGSFAIDLPTKKICRVKKVVGTKCTVQFAERVKGSRLKITSVELIAPLPLEKQKEIEKEWDYESE